MPLLVEHRFDALRESDHVAIEAFQYGLVLLMGHSNDIHRTDSPGLRRERVEERYHLLLVGDGHIQSFQVGVLVQHFCENVDTGNLKVLILRIDSLIGKLLIEVADGE